ncbi:Spx/MgsR family RNA polymerase-binding regulatory protein [Pusillimonas sp. MFBS29]|uniref:Spx/MgsR family RNA polymerase-binding regulatory protein n=1 Tax=Pusillimonas sp. MFBS29 TaxID=2886690 RepID=UPI001D0FA0A6|nr:Spx/MgsR family RNA polymerase-binding regulatory protein [Pusillimonas sp. MFBS29]MCC2596399.1 Spx/MgsR family RNA polymerase-binding regulatory protein [Pusillimonas sp. MFBS29]
MSTVQLYGLKKCSTCIKAVKWLEQAGIGFEFIDYRDHPVAPGRLAEWSRELGGWVKLVNRASMTWRNLPDERKNPDTDEQWLALIAEYPALVRRPVTVTADGSVHVGFSEKKYGELFA